MRARLIVLTILTAILLPLIACQSGETHSVTLTGTVTSATGSALTVAHAHVIDFSDNRTVTSTEVGADGTFMLDVPPGGPHHLWFTAVGHELVDVPLVVDDETNLRIDAVLRANPFPSSFEQVVIQGDWGSDGAIASANMEPRDDGTFAFVAEGLGDAKRIRYQLVGATTNDHTVNGTHSDAFEYDGDGDYFSVLDVRDGRVEIIFDPKVLPAEIGEPRIASSSPAVARAWELMEQAAVAFDEYRRLSQEAEERAVGGEVDQVDRAPVFAAIRAALLATAGDPAAAPALRSFSAIRFLNLAGADCSDEERATALEPLSPTSHYWAVSPWIARNLALAGDDIGTSLREDNPVPVVRGFALAGLTQRAKDAGDTETWRRLHGELKTEFGSVPRLDYHITELDPDKRIMVGRPVPEFRLALLDQEGDISNESVRGDYVLIDFWATWCGPCVEELPNIEKAWDRHRDKNFRILSLSFDGAPEDIAPFREKKSPMTWTHAFVEKGFDSELAKSFEVRGIPKPILIDPNGTIVAIEDTLRGEALLATLDQHLGGREGR